MRFQYTTLMIPGERDEGGYWVKVPALPGCATQGETVKEALANAKEAVKGYVSSLKDRGLPIPQEGAYTPGLISTVAVEIPPNPPFQRGDEGI
jgi:predicted RNase H-like HicB family nuclease